MLNLVTIDINDRQKLEASYNALRNKDEVEIITDEVEKGKILKLVFDHLRIPYNARFSFQNLFLINAPNGRYYIAQCLVDFGFPPVGRGGSQSQDQVFYYYVLGFAKVSVDIGNTNLRPEKKADKWVPRFFNPDIDFENAEQFSEKYYLVSDNREAVMKYFEQPFLDTLSQYDDLLLSVQNNTLFISFESHLQVQQTAVLQKIYNSFKYLAHDN